MGCFQRLSGPGHYAIRVFYSGEKGKEKQKLKKCSTTCTSTEEGLVVAKCCVYPIPLSSTVSL